MPVQKRSVGAMVGSCVNYSRCHPSGKEHPRLLPGHVEADMPCPCPLGGENALLGLGAHRGHGRPPEALELSTLAVHLRCIAVLTHIDTWRDVMHRFPALR